jgi:hypothetical protein
VQPESDHVVGSVTAWSLVASVYMARLLYKSRRTDWRDSKESDLKKSFGRVDFLKYD